MVSIYALVDPVTEVIRYVGRTRHVDARFRSHCSGHGGSPAKRTWVRDLRSRGLKPVLRVLAHCDYSQSAEREREFIKQHAGADLLNIKAHIHYPRRAGLRGIQSKLGRPKLPDGEAANTKVQVALRPDDRDLLERLARDKGVPPGHFARTLVEAGLARRRARLRVA